MQSKRPQDLIKLAHNCFWRIFVRVQGEEINKLAFEMTQVSSQTATGNNCHENLP